MVDANLVRILAAEARVGEGDTVIEVGPGTGTLTEELLATGARVVAVEIDRDLCRLLRERLGDNPRFTLVEGDALDGKHAVNPALAEVVGAAEGRAVLAANLPYHIASPLIIDLLVLGVSRLVFTVQKEVGQRLRADAGDELYGPLSVMARMLADAHWLRTIPPAAFWPRPRIDSAMLRLDRNDRLGGHARAFGRFVHDLFSQRRKTLRNTAARMGLALGALEAMGIDPMARPETLEPEMIFALYRSAGPGGG